MIAFQPGVAGSVVSNSIPRVKLFGRPVDLVEWEGLRNRFRRQRILNTRQVIYGGGQG